MSEISETTKPKKLRRLYVPIVVIICLGFTLSFVMFFAVRNKEWHGIQADFNIAAWNRIDSLQREIETHFGVLRSVHSFFKGSRFVSREEFYTFCESSLTHHRDIQAIEWIPRVHHSEREAYEKAAQVDGYRDFQITKRGTHGKMVRANISKEYFPVFYMEPYKGNEPALGFDLASDPIRLEALNKSRDIGKMVITPHITLVQERGNQHSLLAFIPLYRSQAVLETVEDRRKNLIGFVLGVFHIQKWVEKSLSRLEKIGIDIHIYDESDPLSKYLLCKHTSRIINDMNKLTEQQEAKDNKGLQVSYKFNVADRKWVVVCKAVPEFIRHKRSWQPWGVLIGGLLFVGLLTAYLKNAISRTLQVEQFASKLSNEVNERKKIGKELNRYQDHLEELVETRTAELSSAQEELIHAEKLSTAGKLSASLAHELNSPIFGIRNVLERIKKKVPMGKDNEEFVGMAIRECKRVTDLVKKLKDFHRPSSGEYSPTDIHKTIDEIVLFIQKPLMMKKIKLEKDYAANMPKINTVSDKLEQVILNLLSNARESIPENGGNIKISTRVIGTKIKIDIRDSGCGMTPEVMKHLFDPFFTTKSNVKGTGLGLYISYGIIKSLGGDIKVKSNLNEGSSFTIMLPRKGDFL